MYCIMQEQMIHEECSGAEERMQAAESSSQDANTKPGPDNSNIQLLLAHNSSAGKPALTQRLQPLSIAIASLTALVLDGMLWPVTMSSL
jgi:hypothetical protein